MDKYKVQSSKFKVQSSKFKVQSSKSKVKIVCTLYFVLCTLYFVSGCSEQEGVSQTQSAESAGEELVWRRYNEGMKIAADENRKAFVYFHTDWCGYCRKMEKVFRSSEVSRILNENFVLIIVDAEGREEVKYEGESLSERTLAMRFGVRGYPTMVFLNPDGSKISRVGGYVEKEGFLDILKGVVEG